MVGDTTLGASDTTENVGPAYRWVALLIISLPQVQLVQMKLTILLLLLELEPLFM